MKRSIVVAAISGLAMVGLIMPSVAVAQDASGYQPQEGNDVVVYTHTFKPESFEEASRIVAEEFTAAMAELGQTRQTIFISNPSTYELVAISFFAEGESVEDWHSHAGRLDVLDKLEPMRQEPMVVQRYEVFRITDTE